MQKTIFLILVILLIVSSCKEQSSSTSSNSEIAADTTTNEVLDVTTVIDEVEFPSLDGLTISAKSYIREGNETCILYCHQAGYNKSEYDEIALKLAEAGFNGLAIDQRSGGSISAYDYENTNQTAERAKEKELSTRYLDAEQDIKAAINYWSKACKQKVILWGSSYSASLALKVGLEMDEVKSIIAFSPGEYFQEDGLNIEQSIAKMNKYIFVTSTHKEAGGVLNMVNDLPREIVTQFIPDTKGKHGSKALWTNNTEDGEYYWNAVTKFLNEQK